jgi:hypothetical protein
MSPNTGLTALKATALAIAVAMMTTLMAGCTPECTDKFDCKTGFTCVSGSCQQGSPDPCADGGVCAVDAGP